MNYDVHCTTLALGHPLMGNTLVVEPMLVFYQDHQENYLTPLVELCASLTSLVLFDPILIPHIFIGVIFEPIFFSHFIKLILFFF